uniref:Uncharacterized protein n=1 Tax=Podoviridae sp. ct2m58 TaxID=2827721 RepID=A0A8S5TM90_9CAUD|nr:MAG TPA: hypothetical protein [Podoviridae sp. ct2m58]
MCYLLKIHLDYYRCMTIQKRITSGRKKYRIS